MRLLTYNVFKGGSDEGTGPRLDAIVDILRRAAPDVLVLNECNGFERDGSAVLHAFERALGMRGQLATAGSGYHVALLARGAAWHSCRTLHAGFCHAAIHAELELEGRVLDVLGAHLDPFVPQARASEARALMACTERRGGSRVLMGDLNAISPRDLARLRWSEWPERYRERHAVVEGGAPDTAAIEVLEAAGLLDLAAAAGDPRATRPTRLCSKPDVPSLRLDYIFADAALAADCERVHVLDDRSSQLASDHLPVLAELRAQVV
jgi:endonuclease/exonuclease/phosphatase family metal-dependent hydrolase